MEGLGAEGVDVGGYWWVLRSVDLVLEWCYSGGWVS